ncbi:(+)-cis,trans-nepetalactol synthase NEPS1-like isoform X2 [Quercus robur]|uniref:(+)-cis,trans-nepetalactol synthase NEPS1-like isoform X1 n=1 Tax=Quercus robur TaxID=38942 RepID=UPI002162AD5D|nr:(+)-cis,trans-nepetalactol synthase NEPS1-like isoform X1 [Quercus robur]XP_050257222.1 (+)-cis,trans-nepetalactol synthase NEPS1-like isoform X2 [Quercus robur]
MTDSTPSNKKLQGKVAIITGGASGMGEATARHFATHGARAVVIADVQDEKGRNVAASIGPNICTYVHCDVSDEEQVKTLVDTTVNTYGRLDIMFSNAGVARATHACDQSVLDMELSAYDKLMAVNARGMVACVKHAAKAMVEGRVRGSIVCTTSVAASIGCPKYVDYVMSKHAVLGLVRSASLQLGAYGIRVNCVTPGAVGTPLLKDMFGCENDEEADKMVESCSILKGGMLRPNNVADAVVFLASGDSEFVTGHNLVVDAGFSVKVGQ